jgi:hypothetical protein
VRFSARRPLDARSLSLLAATEQCAGGTDLVRHWLSIFDCRQPMCVGRRRRWTTIRLSARPRDLLCPNPPCLCQRAEGRLQRRHELWSIQLAPALCTPIRRAVWHLGRTRNEVNRANQTTRNLPDSVVVSQRGAVTLVRLSRPAKRNALDIEMMVGIERIFSSPPEGSRAIVLHGDGSHFCAGADLARVAETDGASALRLSRIAHQAFDRIEYGAVPVVAALQGAVIGGGLEIAAAAHIRVAEQSAFYALPEGMRGIFVGGGGAVRVPRLIGTSRMIEGIHQQTTT